MSRFPPFLPPNPGAGRILGPRIGPLTWADMMQNRLMVEQIREFVEEEKMYDLDIESKDLRAIKAHLLDRKSFFYISIRGWGRGRVCVARPKKDHEAQRGPQWK